jgi:hypothetical protein
MSITQGMTSGGSWSGRWTMRAFPRGAGFTSLGRGNMQLVPGLSNTELLVLLALAPLVPGGAAVRVGWSGVRLVTRPIFWAGVNVYEEAEDIAAWRRGEDMSWQWDWKVRPITKIGPLIIPAMYGIPMLPIPIPYLNFTQTPSSGVGGPGEIPNLHRPPLSMQETGEILSNPPMAGGKTGSPRRSTSKKRRKRCPTGMVWSPVHKKCILDITWGTDQAHRKG